jgi:hypothetical protein
LNQNWNLGVELNELTRLMVKMNTVAIKIPATTIVAAAPNE